MDLDPIAEPDLLTDATLSVYINGGFASDEEVSGLIDQFERLAELHGAAGRTRYVVFSREVDVAARDAFVEIGRCLDERRRNRWWGWLWRRTASYRAWHARLLRACRESSCMVEHSKLTDPLRDLLLAAMRAGEKYLSDAVAAKD